MDRILNSNEIAIQVNEEVEEKEEEEADISLPLGSSTETNDIASNENGPKISYFSWNTTRGWKAATVLLGNQALTRLGYGGVSVNLVLFLTRVLDQDNADAGDNVSRWNGTIYLSSLIGAFLSDSYWGRYLTCALFQGILVLGLTSLSISSWIILIKPSECGDGKTDCEPTSTIGVISFYISIYLVAIGYGGNQSTLAAFGADQFDDTKTSKATFFTYYSFALNFGALFSTTVLAYYENSGEWTLGFLVSLGSVVFALMSFLTATPCYRRVKPCGNPLPRLAQVFVATIRKRHVKPANADNLNEQQCPASTTDGFRKIRHSPEILWLDKAATITEDDMNGEKYNPWRLCTVTQVEEAKCILKMLPIWLCTIIYSIILAQPSSFFVQQGDVMNAKIGNIDFPPATMTTFGVCSVLIFTFIYEQLFIPIAGKLSGNPKGLSELQRMGMGLVIGLLSMVAAGITEIQRLKHVTKGQRTSSLSIFWQIPQYVIMGASEVFMYPGQLELFNVHAPDRIKTIGTSLCAASRALGSYANSLLVIAVMDITTRGASPGWIPKDLNGGHMERFYFLLAGLTAFDCVIYYICAKTYNPIKNFDDDDHDPENHQQNQKYQDRS